jgi:hypothetical protein
MKKVRFWGTVILTDEFTRHYKPERLHRYTDREFSVANATEKYSIDLMWVAQIPAEPIQAGGETWLSEINKLFKFNWNKKELPHQWKKSVAVPIHKKYDKIEFSSYRGISLLSN